MKVIEEMKEYKVRNFYDLLTALKDHPEWLEEIRRLVLTEELLNLPKKFDEFVKKDFKPLLMRVDRVERKFDNFVKNEFRPLAERVERVERKFDNFTQNEFQPLAERVERVEKKFDNFVKNEFQPLAEHVGEMDKRLYRVEQDVQVLKQDVKVLKQDVSGLKEDVNGLKQDVSVLKQDVAGLKEDVNGLKQDVSVLKQDVSVLKQDVGELKGDNFERKVREKASAYFGRFLRRIRLIDHNKLADMLDDAIDSDIISDDDKFQLLKADGVLKGKVGKDGNKVWVVFEASYVVDKHDVERAQKRAKIFEKVVGETVLAAVVGKKFVISPEQVEAQGVLAIQVSI